MLGIQEGTNYLGGGDGFPFPQGVPMEVLGIICVGGGFHVNFCSEQARVVPLPSPNPAAPFKIYKEDPPLS